MIAVDRKKKYAGAKSEIVLIQADTTPEVFPGTGAGVDELPDDIIIAAGSIIYTLDTSKTYIYRTDGVWKEWNGNDEKGAGAFTLKINLVDENGDPFEAPMDFSAQVGLYNTSETGEGADFVHDVTIAASAGETGATATLPTTIPSGTYVFIIHENGITDDTGWITRPVPIGGGMAWFPWYENWLDIFTNMLFNWQQYGNVTQEYDIAVKAYNNTEQDG